MLPVLCALASALMYAVASVLQQRSAAAQSKEHYLKLGLLTRLVQRPMWLIGIATDLAGYVLQAVALWKGTLVVVQPLLVSGLLFALPLGARLAGVRLRAREWLAALGVCAGLALFLTLANPAAGHANVRPHVWVELLVPSAAVVGVLVLAALRRTHGRHQAVLLSAAAGILYGICAALTKTSAHLLARGIVPLVTHWQPYLLVVGGVAGMLLATSAFQAHTLDASLPTMTVVDPVVSILVGASAFGETVHMGQGRGIGEVVGLAALTVGVFALARTSAVQRLHADPAPVDRPA